MDRIRHIIDNNKQGLWILAAAVCLLQFVPLHLHLHHNTDSVTTDVVHTVDIHIADTISDHQHHDNAHVIDLNNETVVKKLDGDWLVPLLCIGLIVVLLLPATRPQFLFLESPIQPSPHLYLIFSALRAPPQA